MKTRIIYSLLTSKLTLFMFSGCGNHINTIMASPLESKSNEISSSFESKTPVSPSIGRQFIGNEHIFGLYENTMPTVGTPGIVVFVVDFPDDDTDAMNYSVSDIERFFFDLSRINEPVEFNLPVGKEMWSVDFFSMRDYFYRSSYGKLDITGTVIHYVTKNLKSAYTQWNYLIDEVLENVGHVDALNWRDYDTSGTGFADGVFVVIRNFSNIPGNVAGMAIDQTHHYNVHERDGIIISAVAGVQGLGYTSFIHVLAHEAVHLMGISDIYTNTAMNPGGSGATSVMDGQHHEIGDLPGIFKYVFGWIAPKHIYNIGETQVTLAPISDYPEFVIIHPNGDRDNLNWFVVEYITSTNNNFHIEVEPEGGLRIWRVSMNPYFFDDHVSFFQPFDFIEAAHPSGGDWDYFFYPGDSFSPHTELNSNYPRSFHTDWYNVRTMQNLADSGIYLENIVVKNGLVSFTITIRVD